MIVFCSAIFWAGLFGLFFEGFRFIGAYIPLTNEIVEYLFSMFFLSLLDHAGLLDGHPQLHRPLPVARGGLPADDPGLDRPHLRLQVLRGDRLLELGIPAPGEPDDGGLRHHGRCVGVLLRDLPGLPARLRAAGGGHGGRRRDPDRQLPAEAAQDDPDDRRDRPRGAGRRRGPADAAGPPATRSRATG